MSSHDALGRANPPELPDVAGYLIVRAVGRPGPGRAFAAVAEADGRSVVIRVVSVAGLSADRVDRFLANAATCRSVAEPHMVPQLETLLSDDGEAVALIDEDVEVLSLRELVTACGPLTPGQIVTLVTPLAAAVQTLHRSGAVHGGLSPDSVGIDPEGRPRLLGVGLGALVQNEGERLFRAPEVGADALGTPAGDVFALGRTLAYAVSDSDTSPAAGVMGAETAVSPGSRDGREAIERLVRGMCALDPAARPQAHEVAATLVGVAPPAPLPWAARAAGLDLAYRLRVNSGRPVAGTTGDGTRGPRGIRRSRPARTASVAAGTRSRGGRHRGTGTGGIGSRSRTSPGFGATSQVFGWAIVGALAVIVGALFVIVLRFGIPGASGLHTSPTTGKSGTSGMHAPPTAGSAGTSGSPAPTNRGATSPVSTEGPVAPSSNRPTPRSGTAATTTTPVGYSVRHDPAAPEVSPTALLQGLADLRALAWRTLDAAVVDELAAAGSPARRADRHDLIRAREARVTYRDLAFTVRGAELVSPAQATRDQPAPPVRIAARVDTSAHVVATIGGEVDRPAAKGETLVFTLVWATGRWQVDSVSTASPARS